MGPIMPVAAYAFAVSYVMPALGGAIVAAAGWQFPVPTEFLKVLAIAGGLVISLAISVLAEVRVKRRSWVSELAMPMRTRSWLIRLNQSPAS